MTLSQLSVNVCVLVLRRACLGRHPGFTAKAGKVTVADPFDDPPPRQNGLQRLSDWPTVRFLVLEDYKILDQRCQILKIIPFIPNDKI